MESTIKRVYNLLHGENAFEQSGIYKLANDDRDELKLFVALMNDKAKITFEAEGDAKHRKCKCTIVANGAANVSHFNNTPYFGEEKQDDELVISNKIVWNKPISLGELFHSAMEDKLRKQLGKLPENELRNVINLFACLYREQLTDTKTFEAAVSLFDKQFTFKDLFCSLVLNGRDLNDIVSKGLKFDAEIEKQKLITKQTEELMKKRADAQAKQLENEKKIADEKIAELIKQAEAAKTVAEGHEAHRKAMKAVIREALEKYKDLMDSGAPQFSKNYCIENKRGTATEAVKDRLECHKHNFDHEHGNQYIEFLRDALLSDRDESLIQCMKRYSDESLKTKRLEQQIDQKNSELVQMRDLEIKNDELELNLQKIKLEMKKIVNESANRIDAFRQRSKEYLKARENYVTRGVKAGKDIVNRFASYDGHYQCMLDTDDIFKSEGEVFSDESFDETDIGKQAPPSSPVVQIETKQVRTQLIETEAIEAEAKEPTNQAINEETNSKANDQATADSRLESSPKDGNGKSYIQLQPNVWTSMTNEYRKEIWELYDDLKKQGKSENQIVQELNRALNLWNQGPRRRNNNQPFSQANQWNSLTAQVKYKIIKEVEAMKGNGKPDNEINSRIKQIINSK